MASLVRTLLSLMLLATSLVSQSLQQENPIVMGPENTVTAVGEDAVFYCKIRGPTSNVVYWVVDRSIGLGPYENTNVAYPRYEIFGETSLGYFNLRIKNVTVDDAVRYDCVIDNVGTSATNYEAGATLTVVTDVAEATGPECVDGLVGDIFFTEGDSLTNYRCRATDGIPLGELRWNILRSDLSIADVDYDITVGGTVITATSSRYELTAADDESQLACSLSHPQNPDRTCFFPTSGQIRVRHLPQIEFGPAISVHYTESTTVSVRCSASAYPSIQLDDPQLSFSDPEMVFEISQNENGFIEATVDVSQGDVGKHINCSASNALGTTIATIEIKLQPVLPIWLLFTLLIIAVFLLLFVALCCCFCCCNGCKTKTPADDQPDHGDTKAAGYDVNGSRSLSTFKPNSLNGDNHLMPADDGFTDIPLDDFTDIPIDDDDLPPPPPTEPPPEPQINDLETGEFNDGYMTSDVDERFPPMVEDEHLMGEKSFSTFKPGSMHSPPPPPPPPPLSLDSPKPIPSVDAE